MLIWLRYEALPELARGARSAIAGGALIIVGTQVLGAWMGVGA